MNSTPFGTIVSFKLPAGRTMAAVISAGLLGTTAEAGLLHFRGAFHNPLMMVPVALPPVGQAASTAPVGSRRIHLADGWHAASVWQRDALAAGQTIAGPAIVEQEDTTTLILPGWTAVVDRIGTIIVTASSRAPTSPG